LIAELTAEIAEYQEELGSKDCFQCADYRAELEKLDFEIEELKLQLEE
jgi:hypothetical protein